VLITTKVVSSNPVHGEVNSIQHYLIKLFSNSRHAGLWFSPVSSTNKTDHSDIAEILLKVALITLNLTQTHMCTMYNTSNYIFISEMLYISRLFHR
jgi:hypothetical protein